ncbi:MAG: FAD-binding protein [Gammaproteobacteria bacterium]|nr:FAD-binding protein [Gammaproteobacteria bacterium]MCY4281358.1 FAD-binding protein [Gammaproteobacteria bacterium]MCY4337856.1 FAD-binding protein [Gammaproteobacteria bacterium]
MNNEHFSPELEQQALELVQWSVAEGKTLAIRGTNTKQGFGLPIKADCVLTMWRLAGICEYHPEELVMVALPGTPLAEIRQELTRHNQHLAFEPPSLNRLYRSDEEGTLGGVFMGNLAGPRRFKAGSARDHILGVRAINGRGELWKSGGKVIKNVSGYDMSKLLTGSWGTLSVVTELSFKVLPAPPVSRSLAVWGLSPRLGLALLAQVASTPCEASGLAYLPAAALAAIAQNDMSLKDEALTLIRMEGTEVSVAERVQAIHQWLPPACQHNLLEQAESALAWSWVCDAAPLFDEQRTPIILKISMPPADAWNLIRFIDELRGCLWYLDAAGGWLWVGICQVSGADKLHALIREVRAAAGSATLYRAPLPVKQSAGIYCFADESVKRLNEKIKHSFDPSNLFNPGRLGLN